MNPREDEDDYLFDESDDAEPILQDLRIEMIRLQAEIDQLAAAARERSAEIALLRSKLAQLESRIEAIRSRFRRDFRLWVWIAAIYGVIVGIGVSYLMKW